MDCKYHVQWKITRGSQKTNSTKSCSLFKNECNLSKKCPLFWSRILLRPQKVKYEILLKTIPIVQDQNKIFMYYSICNLKSPINREGMFYYITKILYTWSWNLHGKIINHKVWYEIHIANTGIRTVLGCNLYINW